MDPKMQEELEDEIVVEELEEEGQDLAPEPEQEEDELEKYSKNVQKRIGRLTEKMRQEQRDREEAVRVAQQLLQEKQQLEGRLKQLDSGYLNEYGARIEAQIASARRAYKEAYDAGDTDKMIEAQEAIARATNDKSRYDLAKSRADRQPVEAPRQPQYQPQQYSQPQPQQPQVDPKAQSWAEKNTWFGQDEVMTYAAFGIHRKLVEDEGFDPQSEEYYTEIDRRMKNEFPHKFNVAKNTGKTRVAPAGSSASRSTTPGRRTVKLSPSQIAIAKRLGVPLEEYAKYVKD
jgi:hypothetical protein